MRTKEPSPKRNAGSQSFRTVLLPLTLGEGMRDVLELAVALAVKRHTEVVLLYVFQMQFRGGRPEIPNGRLRTLLCEVAKSSLERSVEMMGMEALLKVVVHEGRIEEAIAEIMKDVKAGLLILCAQPARRL